MLERPGLAVTGPFSSALDFGESDHADGVEELTAARSERGRPLY
jgi:hypothetical protein